MIDLESGEPGPVFWIGALAFPSEDAASVLAGYEKARESGAGQGCKVKRRGNCWRVVACRQGWIK